MLPKDFCKWWKGLDKFTKFKLVFAQFFGLLFLLMWIAKTVGVDGTVGDVTWVVHGPKRVEKGLGEAHFELMEIAPSYLYGTSAPPSDAAE